MPGIWSAKLDGVGHAELTEWGFDDPPVDLPDLDWLNIEPDPCGSCFEQEAYLQQVYGDRPREQEAWEIDLTDEKLGPSLHVRSIVSVEDAFYKAYRDSNKLYHPLLNGLILDFNLAGNTTEHFLNCEEVRHAAKSSR
jgi:hypothetical protein